MKNAEKAKQTSWSLDLRVRDRMLASGTLDPKALERHLAELPDLDANAETVPYEQPALARFGSHSDGGQ